MTAELIFVGTELLLGDILNTNAQYLSKKLAENGINVLFQTVVGDNESRLSDVINLALSRSDLIITTGGLGPTPDDLTKETVAKCLNLTLEDDDETIIELIKFFALKNMEMPESNLKQAKLPFGSIKLPNRCGTAPGCIVEHEGRHIVILPGPPREMEAMFEQFLEVFNTKLTKEEQPSQIVSYEIRTFGIGESALAQKVEDLLRLSNPTVAPYAKTGEALLRVTAKIKAGENPLSVVHPILTEIYSRVGEYIYGVNVPNLETALVQRLREKEMTVAVAESCTGGLVAKRITDVSGSSSVFEMGAVTYSDRTKALLLGIDKNMIKSYHAVSPEIATEMARGVREVSGADIGISTTGIAGPDTDESGQPVGTIYVGIATRRGAHAVKVTSARTGFGCREYNREVTASRALYEAIMSL